MSGVERRDSVIIPAYGLGVLGCFSFCLCCIFSSSAWYAHPAIHIAAPPNALSLRLPLSPSSSLPSLPPLFYIPPPMCIFYTCTPGVDTLGAHVLQVYLSRLGLRVYLHVVWIVYVWDPVGGHT